MEKEEYRRNPPKRSKAPERQIYEDECILPFKSELWLQLKTLICSNCRDIETLNEILSCLRSIKSRDSEKGRLVLDATYELFLAQHILMTTNCDSNIGKEKLTRIFGVTVSRVVDHLYDMQICLENYRGGTIKEALKFFKTDIDIANYRNDFVHGNMPSFYVLYEAIDKLTELIIEIYWKAFDGDISWPKDESNNEMKIVENIQGILDIVKSPDTGLSNYNNFINQDNVKKVRHYIITNCNLFIKLLMTTKNLIIFENVDVENNITGSYTFVPLSHHLITMKNILKLLSEDGDVFELARFTGECAIETENEYIKKQYIYWTSWLVKKIVTEKLIDEWEVKELVKLCIILDLKECLDKILENYPDKLEEFASSCMSKCNEMETDDEVKVAYVCGPWGS